jgi:predicted transcriptional regulator
MSQKSRKELLQILRTKYAKASRSERHMLLETLVNATGYNRKYAIQLLNQPCMRKTKPRVRQPKYGPKVAKNLRILWEASNYLCGKRLVPFMQSVLPRLEGAGHLSLDDDTREKLLEMSPSTVDRLLRKERQTTGRSRSLTKAGSLLRKHVSIRTFADWNDGKPGFLEIDTVGHEGGIVGGEHLHTLTMTDVATGWTELFVLPRKTDEHAFEAIVKSLDLFPFPILGLDSDNGTEFMNHKLIDWCSATQRTFTRSRPYRKNDQCYVEEKNGSVVRKLVGHERHSGARSLGVLTQLYQAARIYVNYFQPSMKLISKERTGAQVKRVYDVPKTPADRLEALDPSLASFLQLEREKADPMKLIATIRRLQKALFKPEVSQSRPAPLPPPRTLPAQLPAKASNCSKLIAEHFRNSQVGEIVRTRDLYCYTNNRSATVSITVSRLISRGLVVKYGVGEYCKADPSLDLTRLRGLEELERLKQVVENESDTRTITKRIQDHFLACAHGEVVTSRELLKYTTGNSSTVSITLKRLIEKGQISKCGRGKYCRFDETVSPEELASLRSITLLPSDSLVTR